MRGSTSAALPAFLILLLAVAVGQSAAGPCVVTPSSAWKSAVDFPFDPFRADSGLGDGSGWIKFTILTCDPTQVYYQDSVTYPFHYEFATQRLDPFLGMTVEEYAAVTLFNDGRQAALGATVLPPLQFPQIPEYGIQLISEDPLDPADVVTFFNAARSTVNATPGVQAFYFPTFEQQASAEANVDFLAANGIIVSSPARWAEGNTCYSKGWALGHLKYFPADQIDAAFQSGALTPSDILLTDGVPADMPLVAGVISLAPVTPNSHVAILAQTFQVPFAFLGLAEDAARAQALVGRRIVLRAFEQFLGFDSDVCDVRLIDVEDELTGTQIDEILALKAPAPLNLQPVAQLGQYGRSADLLTPSSIRYFGGKASNFGILRRSIPASSPAGLGISFDLWTEFLDQTLAGGTTLRQQIDAILAGHSFPPPDMQLLSDDLDVIQDAIKDTAVTSFTPAQEAAILALLQQPVYGFDPLKKIRFRSSTNVEDSEQFTGAGLYESFSGCLADELDADTTGPSHCDPGQQNERGVFRAIRKVFASFYRDNAVLERLRHGVDESEVGMALLVHHSFPDEIELANGVATYRRSPGDNDEIDLVTQLGASSVTNPEPGAIPEEVRVKIFPGDVIIPTLVAESNLVLLGETVMDWTADYLELSSLLRTAADRFQTETGVGELVLDFEYKKMEPGGGALPAGGLVVKQIRSIPIPDTTPSITPFLVNEPARLVTLGSPPGRVKAIWDVATRNMWLNPATLATDTIYTDIAMEYNDGCRALQLEGTVAGLPGATHSYDVVQSESFDSWAFGDLPNPRTYTLKTPWLGVPVSPAESPILTLRDLTDLGLPLTIVHQDPVPQTPGGPLVTQETIAMGMALDPADEVPVCRLLDPGGGITVDTCYFNHPPPDICAGCAPILSRFGQTTITGLTADPIVLDDPFSQTYIAGQHAFFEVFRFEPVLERGIPFGTLSELEAQDIRVLEIDIINIGPEPELTAMLYGAVETGQVCAPPTAAGALATPALDLDLLPGGDLALTWSGSCVASDDDYSIYEGALGDFTSHAPSTCSTGGATAATLPPPAHDAYYVVVPRNAHFEGSYGAATSGPRAPAASACLAAEPTPCP